MEVQVDAVLVVFHDAACIVFKVGRPELVVYVGLVRIGVYEVAGVSHDDAVDEFLDAGVVDHAVGIAVFFLIFECSLKCAGHGGGIVVAELESAVGDHGR